MAISADAQQKTDAYLNRLRDQLRSVREEDVLEIIAELRSHIADKVAAGTTADVGRILAALGSPEDLAREYLADNLLARAAASRSPVRTLGTLFRWASMSVAGVFVLLGTLTGYFLAGAFFLVSVLKPFYPHTAGLWTYRDSTGDLGISLRLGIGNGTSVGTDLLGWWVVPIGMVAAGTLVMLTTWAALGFMRRYRRSLLLVRS